MQQYLHTETGTPLLLIFLQSLCYLYPLSLSFPSFLCLLFPSHSFFFFQYLFSLFNPHLFFPPFSSCYQPSPSFEPFVLPFSLLPSDLFPLFIFFFFLSSLFCLLIQPSICHPSLVSSPVFRPFFLPCLLFTWLPFFLNLFFYFSWYAYVTSHFLSWLFCPPIFPWPPFPYKLSLSLLTLLSPCLSSIFPIFLASSFDYPCLLPTYCPPFSLPSFWTHVASITEHLRQLNSHCVFFVPVW